MSKVRKWLRFRASEWLLIAFFAYLAVLSPFFPQRPNLRYQPVIVLAAVLLVLSFLAWGERTRSARVTGMVRDWFPILLTLIAFREMELFLPSHFEIRHEARWITEDGLLLDTWHLRAALESLGKIIPFYLEVCYLLVYGLPAYCVGLLYGHKRRAAIDFFLSAYLVGTLGTYALFPFFPSRPPRIVFPGLDNPHVTTWVRQLNLYILSKATIHVGVFPSAHVSSAFAAAWAMFFLFPKRRIFGASLLVYAISVSLAAIYGRYHYTADVLGGFGVSLFAIALCIAWRSQGRPSSLAAP